MPQFNVDTFLPQLVWLAITFVILYFVMARLALPKVAEVLEGRQNRIDDDLEQAETYRKESEQLEASYEELTAKARAEALSYLKAERDKIQAAIDEKRADLAKDLDGRLAEAEAKVAKAKTEAMADLEGIASEACTSIVTKLTGAKMTPAAAKKAVRANLKG